MEKSFEIDQKTFGSRIRQINEAKKKFNKLKREYESRENEREEEFVVDVTKRLAIAVVSGGDQSNSKSRSVRQREAKIKR